MTDTVASLRAEWEQLQRGSPYAYVDHMASEAVSPFVERLLAEAERLDRVVEAWIEKAGEWAGECSRLTAQRDQLREAQELLDMVELPIAGSYDGTIADGAPTSIDLFAPGPKFEEWANKVRANRAARRVLAATASPKETE